MLIKTNAIAILDADKNIFQKSTVAQCTIYA